jgi:cysteine desulfurase
LIIGEGALRVPGVVCLAAPGVPAAVQVMALDLEGVMVSAGAACSSGRVEPSFALKAMGVGDLAGCAIRASSGWRTSLQDWSDFAEVFIAAGARLTARRRLKEGA